MKLTRALLKYGFGLFVLAIVILLVPFGEVVSAARNLTLESIGVLLLVSVLLIYVSVLKWKLFLEAYGTSPNILWLFHLYLVGYFVNLLFPSFLGGDAYRSWSVGKRSSHHTAAAATVLERYTGFLAMLFLGACALFFVDNVPRPVVVSVLGFGAILFLGTVAALSSRTLRLLPGGWKVTKKLAQVQEAFHLARRNLPLLWKVVVLSFFFHVVAVMNVGVAAAAVGWHDFSWIELCTVVPLILLIGSIPLSPSGLGLQEGAYVYFLALLGASPAEALAVGLVLRAKIYFLACCGGVGFGVERLLQQRRPEGYLQGEKS
ncbi:MAG: flippase-like domain-containing protein [Bdellovibrionales bacterium]|nr:flippase-like domain-containing protein [Bdellovibrionales bacterium]